MSQMTKVLIKMKVKVIFALQFWKPWEMYEILIKWPRCPENTRRRRWGVATGGEGGLTNNIRRNFSASPLLSKKHNIFFPGNKLEH